MADHRLPGMSIGGDQWAALTELADCLGVTRTDLIRRAIAEVLEPGGSIDQEMYMQLRVARSELAAVNARLDAVRAVLASREPVAA